mmetsp:Transcript_12506/g.22801  ORF Transcript_12506/g.22801 Transcript_12506/m.22801 type:complete len:605 (-) Transcript_12506:35-1849(-)
MGCQMSSLGGVQSPVRVVEAKRPSQIKLYRSGKESGTIGLHPITGMNITSLTGMIALKNKINGIAAKMLPDGIMNQKRFASFKELSEQESAAKSLDELYVEAETALPEFEETVRRIVVESGLDPDFYPLVEGKKVVDDDVVFKALTVNSLKRMERTVVKVKNKYDGNFLRVFDLVRCSITVETEEQLGRVLTKLLATGNVVRLKNRFATPLPSGIRDCLLNIKIAGHICEVQLHLSYIIKEKGEMHTFYNFFRELFSDASESYTDILDRAEVLGDLGSKRGEGEGSVAANVSKLLHEGDLKRLRGLGLLVGSKTGFGDEDLDLEIRKRIKEVIEAEGGEGEGKKLELLDAYFDLGAAYISVSDFDNAKIYFRQAKEGYEEQLGSDSEKALEVTYELILMTASIDDENIEKIRDLLKRMEGVLGKENALTLKGLKQLGDVLMENGVTKEAKEVYKTWLMGQEKIMQRLPSSEEDQRGMLVTLMNVGAVNYTLQNYEKALEFYQRALKGEERTLGKAHPNTLKAVMNIAIVCEGLKDYGKAEEYHKRALGSFEEHLGNQHQHTKNAAKALSQCYEKSGNTKGLKELRHSHPNVEAYDFVSRTGTIL